MSQAYKVRRMEVCADELPNWIDGICEAVTQVLKVERRNKVRELGFLKIRLYCFLFVLRLNLQNLI